MAVDLEEDENDYLESVNSLYKPADAMVQEEDPLLEEPVQNRPTSYTPKDHLNGTYIIFFLLGTGSLLPLNFIMTAKHYWMYKLQNCSEELSPAEQRPSDIRDFFESYISVASTVPSVLCLIGNFLLVNKVPVHVRILSSLVVTLTVLMVITVLVKVDTSSWTPQFFVITLACVAIISSATTVFSSSVFGLTGCFPMQNSQALISGKISPYYIKCHKDSRQILCILPGDDLEEGDSTAGNTRVMTNSAGSVPPLRAILDKTGMLGFCVFYVYFISIMIFPAISSGIESVTKDLGGLWADKYFTPLTSFLLYNFADWCGRQITAWIHVPGPKSKLLPTMVLLRTLLVPIFMLCNYQPRMYITRVLFAQDVYPVVFTVLLGFSNGYLSTLSIIYGPKVTPKELSESTGVLLMVFMQLGLAMGAAFSVLVVHLI
ncbi:PREDICTED: equilibrative nucleoside transporter 3 [Gekko japonicus]|uniref:Equilibrative nucleoside transporter 3 n=1 Tax=Gekko japonicus TaxID=146911 RepID=A0ABM1KXE1_GEKJA|nr:PREDICTED: equilibrative nucleoside transporter 3 [Gekko japonicus]